MFPPTTTLLSFLSATIIFSVPLSLGNDHEVEFQSGVQEVKFNEIKTGDQKFFDQEIKLFFHSLGDQKLK